MLHPKKAVWERVLPTPMGGWKRHQQMTVRHSARRLTRKRVVKTKYYTVGDSEKIGF